MIAAHNGQYAHAALVILLAAGLDCLDGKVARLTGSSSAFGVEYDSSGGPPVFWDGPRLAAVYVGLALTESLRLVGGFCFCHLWGLASGPF